MITDRTLAIRQQFVHDPHRPRYHFLAPSNWMNDPNGFIQWQGKYHLFYQHNPNGAFWGDMHWGHAISDDLVHWTDLPIALTPTLNSPDAAGCFSGCAVNNDGVPTIIYTSTVGTRYEVQTQSIATSSDGLLTWEKYAGNPVLSEVPAESGQIVDFRDPFVWKEDDAWYMVIGSRIQDVGGAVFLYRSQNLTEWEYLNPLLIGDIRRTGAVWECPNFFKLGDQWVLIISAHTGMVTGTVFYFVGSYENYRFTPTYEGVLDYGHLYAPLTTLDDQNRRLLIGWTREARSEIDQRSAGWSGAQSIPRILTLDQQQRLLMSPIPQLESIHGRKHHYQSLELTHEMRLDVSGLALDIAGECSLQSNGNFGIALACSPNGVERIEIVYEASRQRLITRKIALDMGDSIVTHVRDDPHELTPAETLKLRILLDGSVVEVIANDRISVTSRIYPAHADHNGVHLFGVGAHVHTLDIWEMPSVWR